jgi:hypothetical protein
MKYTEYITVLLKFCATVCVWHRQTGMSRLYFLDVSRVYVEAPVIRDRHRVLPLALHEKKKDGKIEEKYADNAYNTHLL